MQPTNTQHCQKKEWVFPGGCSSIYRKHVRRQECACLVCSQQERKSLCQWSNCCDLQGAPSLQNSVIGAPVLQPQRVQLELCVRGLLGGGGAGRRGATLERAMPQLSAGQGADRLEPRCQGTLCPGCADVKIPRKRRKAWVGSQARFIRRYEAFSF